MNARREIKVPIWVKRVAAGHGTYAFWHLMHKKISSSDVCNHQNRLLIGKRVIYERLLPAMSEEEKQAASFLNYPEVGRRRRFLDRLPGGERRRRLIGRNHRGLKVMAYDQRGWGCSLFLTRWDGSGAAVLKGPNYRAFRRHSFMEEGDEVEVWTFRDEDGKLCFAVGNTTVSSFFSL
ncbi:hypothetical protein HPP92_018320 [Vanilla planifolia]|uniref:TF-B3 domain-containing protein n=1 Tax=Vanilla planifolia TaxID=51239 RepID=A0A835Q9K1_VANPL|nr:hypothetical protein HPP92_018320 [Vanilla planifolia]